MNTPSDTATIRYKPTGFLEKYGPWAVVTGASDGIGRAIACDLARRGMNLVLVARREQTLRDLADELTREFHIEVSALALDLSDTAAHLALVNACRNLNVGLLVAAAGFGASGMLTEIEPDTELNMIDVNCRAVVAVTHHFARVFQRQGRGGIVLMSSLVAFQGVPRATTYAASKAFIQSFAEGLQRELSPYNVDVLASAPGPVSSGFMARANMTSGLGVTSETVAKQTMSALGRTSLVRPGLISKLLEWSLKPLPRGGRVRIMELVMGGMTRHSRAENSLATKELHS